MIPIQKVLTDFQMICSSVSWFGRFMKANVMDDFTGRTITDTQIGRYLIGGHKPICQNHVIYTPNIVSFSGCGFVD